MGSRSEADATASLGTYSIPCTKHSSIFQPCYSTSSSLSCCLNSISTVVLESKCKIQLKAHYTVIPPFQEIVNVDGQELGRICVIGWLETSDEWLDVLG